MIRKKQNKAEKSLVSKPSKLESNFTMVLWAVISVLLWLITPDQFTKTEGPAGVLTMIVVAIIGLVIAVTVSHKVMQLYNNDD